MNAIAAVTLTLTNGLLGIVATRYIIATFGSDFNGLNSTANQLVNMLLILEGGFTVASNVALFSPLGNRDFRTINGILAATREKFHKIGVVFLIVGFAISLGYTFLVNSQLPWELILTILWMTIFPAAFNLFFATTYRVLLQSQQKEYIVSGITALTIGLGHVTNILLITHGGKMWMVRFVTMTFSLLNSLLIIGYVKRCNSFLNFQEPKRRDLIKGTGDVLAQKITGVVYNAAPIVFLSVSPAGGTALASVYAVYNNVFIMLKSLLHGVIDAPRFGFGQMLTERKKEDVWQLFAQYEYIAFSAVFIFLTTAHALILPFVKLYTVGITDINYSDSWIALLMTWIAAIEMIHIPSGHLLNMAGLFRISRNIQIVACIVLLTGMSIGGTVFGVYGMLIAVLCTAVLLACLEIGYVHISFFRNSWKKLLATIVPYLICGTLVGWLETSIHISIEGYIPFVLWGCVFFLFNCAAAALVSVLFCRREFASVARRCLRLLHRG